MKSFTFFFLWVFFLLPLAWGKREENSGMVQLTKENYFKVFLPSSVPWLILLHDRNSPSCKKLDPQVAMANLQMRGKVRVGKVDVRADDVLNLFVRMHGIFAFKEAPRMAFFLEGGKSKFSMENFELVKYESWTQFVTWIERAIRAKPPKVPELVHLSSPADLNRQCRNRTLKECRGSVSILPKVCDNTCMESSLGVVRTVASKHRRLVDNWMWAKEGDLGVLQESLGLISVKNENGYPSMIVPSARNANKTLVTSGSSSSSEDYFKLMWNAHFGSKYDNLEPWSMDKNEIELSESREDSGPDLEEVIDDDFEDDIEAALEAELDENRVRNEL